MNRNMIPPPSHLEHDFENAVARDRTHAQSLQVDARLFVVAGKRKAEEILRQKRKAIFFESAPGGEEGQPLAQTTLRRRHT